MAKVSGHTQCCTGDSGISNLIWHVGASDKGDVGQEFQEKCKSGQVDTLLGAN